MIQSRVRVHGEKRRNWKILGRRQKDSRAQEDNWPGMGRGQMQIQRLGSAAGSSVLRPL